MEENKTYRIRTKVGDDSDKVIHIKLDQHYDNFEILSLKIDQTNNYKTYESDYGVVVGRVLANGGFGIPNAKVSIFIESDDTDNLSDRILYPYKSPTGKNADGVRYNLLTDFLDKACYQNVGTFPNKRLVLDNDDVIDIFDKYYRYTTVTNSAGDYMIFGVPTGSQRLHVDIDLSDIGMLSQRPRDMIYKGYNVNLFDSPNKFKRDTNLNSLAQIISQDVGLYVYPYWGDTSDDSDDIAVTRADINIDYKFEPTCVFMGSIITDTGSNAIGKNCTGTEKLGKMSELIAGEGSIEMIRKTIDGRVEEFQVKGNRVIDGDGVWCYQIPMNLDYIMTDEFGNIVPSDNPNKGIPTRTRVRFRISLDDAPEDNTARKRCRYLVPNNPRLDEELYPNFTKTHEVDYEFGTKTKNENYRDLLWNKVYTVKNYVPRLQKNRKVTDRKHTGIKLINHHEGNNPMPYNNVDIKLGFTYRLLCIIFKIFINLVQFLNQIFTLLSLGFCALYNIFHKIATAFYAMRIKIKAFGKTLINICIGCPIGKIFDGVAKLFWAMIVPCVGISSEMCGDNTTHNYTFFPGCGNLLFSGASAGKTAQCIEEKTADSLKKKEDKAIKDGEIDESERTSPLMGGTTELYNCIETALAEDNDAVSLNFQNDWVNGVLYAPMWFRKITKKKSYLFGLIKRRAKDQWCEGDKGYTRRILRVFNPCSPKRNGSVSYSNYNAVTKQAHYMNFSDNKSYKDSCRNNCHKSTVAINLDNGLIVKRQTMLGQDVYYYKPVEYGSPHESLIANSEDFAVGENRSNGSVKILFATDIVLLGSLNDCDIHGVPQFYKSLESTTFQIPPNILFADNEVRLELKKRPGNGGSGYDLDAVTEEYEVIQESTSEMTGMDWGNYNPDLCGKWSDPQDSGLFYSIGCSTIEMKPKSCINMTRVCEFGVSLDETKAILNWDNAKVSNVKSEDSPSDDLLYDTIVPDGFISKDELYNDDERSMFATLNVNGLSTVRNPENGLMEYTFKHVIADNFDKSLYTYMSERQRKCTLTQRYNYILEEFSGGYYDFRMGKEPYFYDKEFKMPRYENSFYFYFGLNPGKTAIDKFHSQFLAECANDGEAISPIGIEVKANDWCNEASDDYDGYVAFDLSAVDLPCDIIIRRTDKVDGTEYVIKDNEDALFYLSLLQQNELEELGYVWKLVLVASELQHIGLPNGVYDVIVTDNNGEIITTSFTMKAPPLATYVVGTDFYEPDNMLLKSHAGSRGSIAGDVKCLGACDDSNNPLTIDSTRGIGGTIAVLKPYNSKTGVAIDSYQIEVIAEDEQYGAASYRSSGVQSDGDCIKILRECSSFILFGLPKGDENYTIKITELCDGEASDNIHIETIRILEKSPFKLFINGIVDYDVIKHWDCGFDVSNVTLSEDGGTEGTATFKTEGTICNKWWNMSNPSNYMWCFYEPYCDIDKRVCELALMFNAAYQDILVDMDESVSSLLVTDIEQLLKLEAKIVGNPCVNYESGHFFYTDIEIKTNDTEYLCNASDNFTESYATKLANIESEYENLKQLLEDTDFTASEVAMSALSAVMSIDEEIIEYLSEIDTLKAEFINETKRAFQLTCDESVKSITFTVETKDRPVTYHGAYVEEKISEDTNLYTLVNGNKLSSYTFKAFYTKEGDYISMISIPTITYKDSERFGHTESEPNNGLPQNLCYAVDNAGVDMSSKKAKPLAKLCNFIAVINGRGKTIPNDAEVTPDINQNQDEKCGISVEQFRDKKIKGNYFGYHIIDKIFECNYMGWGAVYKIPYFKPLFGEYIDGDKAGVSMCMNGLFAGKIYNGNVTRYEPLGTSYLYDTYFEEQNVGAYGMVIYTEKLVNDDEMTVEDKMPTKRFIVDGKNVDDVDKPYENYRVTGSSESTSNEEIWGLNKHKQYVPLANASTELALSDENDCIISKEVNGNFQIELESSSLNYCSTKLKEIRNESKLNVTVRNAPSEDVLYMVFSASTGYPLNLTEKASEDSYIRYITEEEYEEMGSPDGWELDYDDDNNEVYYHTITQTEYNSMSGSDQSEYTRIPEGACRKTKFDCGMASGNGEDGHLFIDNQRYLFGYYNKPTNFTRYTNPFKLDMKRGMRFGGVECTDALTSKYVNEATEKEIETYGFGNSGEFEFKRLEEWEDNVFYVIAVTENNMRAISPVYDFSHVCARLIFGVVYKKEETTDESGAVNGYEVTESPKMTFDIANVIKKMTDGHMCDGTENEVNIGQIKPEDILYYFYYYPYDISFECKIDDVNTVIGSYTHTAYKDNRRGYVLFDMDSTAYDALYKQYKKSPKKANKTVRKNSTILATDYTGLNHHVDWSGCDNSDSKKHGCGYAYEHNVWISVRWVTNGGVWTRSESCDGNGAEHPYVDADCDCLTDNDENNCLYETDIDYERLFVPGESYNPNNVGTLTKNGCGTLIGWSTSYDSKEIWHGNNDIVLEGKPEESMIYYAVWDCDFVTVTWKDCEGNVIATEEMRIGTILTANDMNNPINPSSAILGWKITPVDGSTDPVNFSGEYTVMQSVIFTAVCEGQECKMVTLRFRNMFENCATESVAIKFEGFKISYTLTYDDDSVETVSEELPRSDAPCNRYSPYVIRKSNGIKKISIGRIQRKYRNSPQSSEYFYEDFSYNNSSKYYYMVETDLEPSGNSSEPYEFDIVCNGTFAPSIKISFYDNGHDEPQPTLCDVIFEVNGTQVGGVINILSGRKVPLEQIPEDSTAEALVPSGKTWVDNKWEWWSLVNENLTPMGVYYTRSEIASTVTISVDTKFVAKLADETIEEKYNVTFKVRDCQIGEIQEVNHGDYAQCPASNAVTTSECFNNISDTFDNEWNLEGTNQNYSNTYIDNSYRIENHCTFVAVLGDTGMRKYYIPWRIENYSSKTLKAGHLVLNLNCSNGNVVESESVINFGGDVQPYNGNIDQSERHGDYLVAQTFPDNWTSLYAYEAIVECQVGNNTVTVTWTRDSGLLVTNTYPRTNNNNMRLLVQLYDTAPSYPVTFNAVDTNGDLIKLIKTENVAVSTKLDSSIIPAEGYICSYASPSGVGTAYEFIRWEPDPYDDVYVWSALTFNAILERKKYDVTFYWDGDNVTEETTYAITVDHGEFATPPPMSDIPTKEGYTFSNWNPDPSTTRITQAGMSFYGVWTPNVSNTFTVTFRVKDANNTSTFLGTISEITVPEGYELSKNDLPEDNDILSATNNADAYDINTIIWKTGNSVVNFDQGETVTITSNKIFNAILDKKYFEVRYKHNNGTGTVTIVSPEPYYGQTISLESAPYYENHTFDGWEREIDSQLFQPGAPYSVVDNVTFNGIWTDVTPGPYSVSFYGDNETLIETQTIQYGQYASAPAVSTVEGRRFTGYWIRRSNNDKVYSTDFATYSINADMQFDAEIVNQFKVRFHTPAYVPIITSQWVDENGNVQTLPTLQEVTAKATEEGLTYMGDANGAYNGEGAWRINSPALDSQTYTNSQILALPISAETTFYARFSCQVTFDYGLHSSQQSTVFSVEKRTYLSSAQIPTPQQQYIEANYQFNGWDGDTSQRIMDNTTFNAQWVYVEPQVTYTVAFYDNDNLVGTINVVQGNTIGASGTIPTASGQNFVGWVYFVNGVRQKTKSIQEVNLFEPTSNCEFRALYKKNYTVKYELHNNFTSTTDDRSYPTKLVITFAYQLGTNPQMTQVVELNGSDIPARGRYIERQFTIENFDFVNIDELKGYNPNTLFDDLGDGWYTIDSGMQEFAYYDLQYSDGFGGTTYNPDASESNVAMVITLRDEPIHALT